MTAISFEFYPPKTDEQRSQLDRAAARLKDYGPEYVSCTFGAGGSTLSYTSETVRHLNQHHGFDAAPHLSCVGGTARRSANCSSCTAPSAAVAWSRCAATCPRAWASPVTCAAAELIDFIRDEHGDAFHIEVGAYPETHPQATDALADLKHFKAKIDAGADAAITQYFYNPDAYFHFVDAVRRLGVQVPITPGIMPIANFSQLRRFSEQCGAEISALGSAARWPLAMTPNRCAHSAPKWWPNCASA
jgi:methylenetetrahydrofolate reductase (NADPH)